MHCLWKRRNRSPAASRDSRRPAVRATAGNRRNKTVRGRALSAAARPLPQFVSSQGCMACRSEPRTSGTNRESAEGTRRVKTVFFDVDTQLDFMYPSGALYVPGAEKIVDQIATLNRSAGAQGIPLVSTMDAHTESDVEFQAWPPHCVAGCLGQHKPEAT